jgi:zinc protease
VIDRRTPPALGQAAVSRFPTIDRGSVAGVELRLARQADSPFVSLSWVALAGGERDPRGREGRATLTASTLDEGTSRSSSSEIAARVERLGGAIGSTADWDAGYLRIEVLARDVAAAFELVGEVLLDPVFPEPEIDRLRRQRLADLQALRERPSAIADVALSRAIYGPATYGRLLGGTEATLSQLGRADLQAAHRELWLAQGLCLVAAGAVTREAVEAWLEGLLGGTKLAATNASLPAPTVPPPSDGRRVILIDRPNAAQSELRIGHLGVARTHPARSQLQVLNAILGGKFTSRINLNLRERHGFTYGAFSRFTGRRHAGPFSVSAAVANPSVGAAVREVLAEMDRIRQQPVDPEELSDARDYLIGVFPYTIQTAADLAGRLEDLAQFGLPDDEVDRHLQRIATTSAADVQAAALSFLSPDDACVVAVGPASELRPQLADFGTLTEVAVGELFS